MLDLTRVTITCFAGSYAIALGLEVIRLLFRAPARWAATMVFLSAGLLTHTAYLWTRFRASGSDVPLSSWYDWCLMAAWVLVAAYGGLLVRQPRFAVGLFVLPLVLALIGVAFYVRDLTPFPKADALRRWGTFHGVTLLIGTVGVTLAFAAGLMYSVQSYRLKHHFAPQGLRLPSLEWLQRFVKESLFAATGFLALGLLSGIVLNLGRSAKVGWTDPVVLSSGVLFAWLLVMCVFEYVYKPARQGLKVTYLTWASFAFLAMAIAAALLGEHAS